ncbi:hypothetical protein BS47DRAFT_1361415 [Hydnum rufescens UP504]|uniref:Uncharacterized protein n=1 Tax=Hydnum rufescens UP504 TaxID=1448309 RepID=A0A9P6AZE8_9AGAM|nr:hypothetical protein BS47DRAFT_1361415 [Hydnum rufescens UP504]
MPLLGQLLLLMNHLWSLMMNGSRIHFSTPKPILLLTPLKHAHLPFFLEGNTLAHGDPPNLQHLKGLNALVEGAQCQHSHEMKLQDLRTIWEISMKHCPGNVVDCALGGGLADLEERALVFKHLLWNFETTNLHFSDLNYYHQEDHGVPHVQITLSNHKGWQKRAQKGDPNLEEL